MKILALEFSSPQRSVAVIRKEESSNATSISEIIEAGNTAPFQMIDDALRDAKLEREQIDCIAVGIGPGSYTGIRSAISIAQGWQLARAIKILGISSVESIAAQAHTDGLTGRVNVIIDAQRDEFYLATYELSGESHCEITSLKIVPLSDIQKHAAAGDPLIGPEVSKWFPSGKTIFPRAAMLATIALNRTNFIPGEKLEPIYLRETKFVKAPPPRTFS
jgi:tRNA threonylcarbamoyl adenosine modification protein YeaZ